MKIVIIIAAFLLFVPINAIAKTPNSLDPCPTFWRANCCLEAGGSYISPEEEEEPGIGQCKGLGEKWSKWSECVTACSMEELYSELQDLKQVVNP